MYFAISNLLGSGSMHTKAGTFAELFGYATQSGLSRACMRWFGMTPQHFRARTEVYSQAPAKKPAPFDGSRHAKSGREVPDFVTLAPEFPPGQVCVSRRRRDGELFVFCFTDLHDAAHRAGSRQGDPSDRTPPSLSTRYQGPRTSSRPLPAMPVPEPTAESGPVPLATPPMMSGALSRTGTSCW